MNVHGRKNHRNVCKVNTIGDDFGKNFVFSYKITFRYPNIAPFA